jgi:hypothetical protein
MPETATSFLAPWSNFYIMAGSSASALTGLMFVVITLVSGENRSRKAGEGISTFSTPTVMHFCAALFVSATLSAPWHSLLPAAVLLGLSGFYGLIYLIRVLFRTRRLRVYVPDLEDWIWYTILPFFAYGAVFAGALMLPFVSADALFTLAGGVVLLVFIGIRNAWDTVTYIAIGGAREPPDPTGAAEKE